MTLLILMRYWHYIVIAILVIAFTLAVSRCSHNAEQVVAVQASHDLTLATERADYLDKINEIERANNKRWQNAVTQNTQAQKQITDSYASNSAIVDSLSATIDKNNAAYLKANANARAEYTAALSDVSKDCTAQLGEMARRSDGHVSDIRMMQEAWPKN